jgi:lipopolysaccharide transport system permease protein
LTTPPAEIVITPPSRPLLAAMSELRALPRYADLLYVLTMHRIRVRYKQSLLGPVWAVLQPLLLMLIFTVLFALVAPRMPSEGLPYPVFVYAAVLPWTYFSSSVAAATASLVGHTGLVTKVWFPREILPLSYVTAGLIDFGLAGVLLFGLMAWHGVAPGPHVLLALPLVGLIAAFALAVGLVTSAVQVRFRDIGIAVPLLLQVWMFLTPVVYPFSHVPERYRWLAGLNPMAGLIEGFRRVTVQADAPDWGLVLISAAVIGLALPAAYLYFKAVDATVADRV